MAEVNGTFSLHASLRVPLLSYKLNFVNFCVGIWGFFKCTECVKKSACSSEPLQSPM